MRPVFRRDSRPGTGTTHPGEKPQNPIQQSISTPSPAQASPVSAQGRMYPTPPTQHTSSAVAEKPTSNRLLRRTSVFADRPTAGNDAKAETEHVGAKTSQGQLSTRNITQTELEVAWRKAAATIATKDRVVSMRMETVSPVLLDQTHIELPVGNPSVESFFRDNKALITEALKQEIGGDDLVVSYRVEESTGPQKILSPHEQMNLMRKENPAFGKLVETLGLTVG